MNSRQICPSGVTGRTRSKAFMTRWTRRFSIATLTMVLTAGSVRAGSGPQLNAGSLDPRFGAGGTVLTDFRVPIAADGRAVAVQPDGKIVVAATVQDAPGRRFGLTR